MKGWGAQLLAPAGPAAAAPQGGPVLSAAAASPPGGTPVGDRRYVAPVFDWRQASEFVDTSASEGQTSITAPRRPEARGGCGTGWRRIVLGAGALLAVTAFAADENQILHPASPAAPGVPVGGGLGSLSLIVGLVLASIGAWLLWRGRRATPRTTDGRALVIEETRPLGNRQYLVVAGYENRKFLLGVCPGRIEMLATLPERKPPA